MEIRSGIDKAFDLLDRLNTHLTTGAKLHPAAREAIVRLAGSTDPEAMVKAITAFAEGMKADYVRRITDTASRDLGAFAEVMNYDQPPAYHHQFICDHLMMAERGELTHFTLSAPPGHAKPIWEDSRVIAKLDKDYKTKKGKYFGKNQYGKKTTLKDVEPGWLVWTHKKRWKKVTEVHEQGVLPVLVIITNAGSVLRAEQSHPLLTSRGWVEAGALQVGDRILTTSPSERVNAFKEVEFYGGTVYTTETVMHVGHGGHVPCRCLTVEEDASFVAEGLIVHNSTYASHLFGAWYMGNHPDDRFLQAGNTQSFVDDNISAKVRGYLREPAYQTVFPEVTISREKSSLKNWRIEGHKGDYTGRGVGGAIAGLRANYANVDDPIATREAAESENEREKTWNWFEDDFSTRLLPGAPMSIIATRWHEDDIIGRLMARQKDKKDDKWEFINLPAIAEEDDPLGRAPGEALWPAFFTLEFLMDLRAESSGKKWNSLYQGHPFDADGGVFNIEWMARYKTLPDADQIKKVTISVDCAQKPTQRSDYTAISVWIESHIGKHYLVNMVRRRVEFTDMAKTINLLARRYGAHEILVEEGGAGVQYIQTHSGRDGRKRKAPCPVTPIPLSPVNTKAFRLDGCVPMIKAGEVLFPEKAEWIPDFEHELSAFPDGTYDDQVDSMTQYLQKSWNVS
ncbi:phage terminase large subunit, partial [Candidatus Macondimonas diazotrophica]|nr:phage terminase large subunit [Candidatus Macondimonas diazotrophica]